MEKTLLTSYRLPKPLFWQLLVIAAVLGIFSLEYIYYTSLSFLLLLYYGYGAYTEKKKLRLFLLCSVFLGSFLWANLLLPKESQANKDFYAENFDPMQEQNICGKILSVQGIPDRRLRITLENVHIIQANAPCLEEKSTILQGKVILTWDNAPLLEKRPLAGEYINVKAKVRPFYGSLAAYWEKQKAWYGIWIYGSKSFLSVSGKSEYFATIRENFRVFFANKLFSEEENLKTTLANEENQAKAILLALLFGDKFYLTQKTMDIFNACNVLHSLALSGQHLSLVGLIGFVFVCGVVIVFPFLYLYTAKRTVIFYVSCVVGILYTWLGSAPFSLLRALAMLIFGGCLWLKNKNITLFDLFFYALLFFCLFAPLSLFDLGVQFSFVSVFAIILILPTLQFLRDVFYSHSQTKLTTFFYSTFSLFLLSSCIQFLLMPLLILYFGRFSWFYVLNILWLPVLSFWILPCTFLGFIFSFSSIGTFFIYLASIPTTYTISLLKIGIEWSIQADLYPFVQSLYPWGISVLGFYLLVLCLFYGFSSQTKRVYSFIIVACILLFFPSLYRNFEEKEGIKIHVLDVGQGQAIFLETKEKRVLLDVGGTSSRRFNVGKDIVAKYITQNHAPSLDYLIASHDDSDHINGMYSLIQTFSLQTFYETSIPIKKESYAKKKLDTMRMIKNTNTQQLQKGDCLDLGEGYMLTVLYPSSSGKYVLTDYTANNSSLVFRLTHNNKGIALFCGDIEEEAIKTLIQMEQEKQIYLQAEVFILPHHGSGNSFNPQFYEKVKPNFVVASCGKYNRFGFPDRKIRAYFANKGKKVFTTAEYGTICFIHNKNKPILQVGSQ